jgi:predicted SprT family Zn-dependent metalloprotease
MSDLERVQKWANALIRLHLDPKVWTFGFDNAKTRAGLCNFTHKRISVSRYIATSAEDDDIHQVLLHEIAHALAGPRAGHGPVWKRTAADIGYIGTRLYSGANVHDLAPWVGTCPAGHQYFRHRRPTRVMSCTQCYPRFDARHLITWAARPISASERRAAAG